MTVRLFVDPATVAEGHAVLRGEALHYATRVMRLGVGDTMVLLDGLGEAHDVRITSVTRERLEADVVASRPVPEPPVPVTLYQALPKADKLEWILQKATELGASRIVPVVAQHSIAQVGADKLESKLERWRKIAREAAEQCERGRILAIEAPMPLAAVRLHAGQHGLVLAERRHVRSLFDALMHGELAKELALFVGPEGGWAPAELEMLSEQGCEPVSLGPRILRTETAAVAALALVMARYEL